MKTKTLSLALIAALSGFTMNVQAAEDATVTNADASVKKSERKTVFGLSELGLEAKTYTFPITYCPLKGKCVPRGSWSITIDQNYADEILNKELGTLISNRYDKIIASKGDISIETPTEDFIEKLDSKSFDFETGSFEEFDKAVLKYLNESMAPKVAKALEISKEARYKNTESSEYQTFINTQAKETGIPAHMLEKLMSSSYAFALYLPKITGAITISQVERTDAKGNKYIAYSSTLSAPLNTKLLIYKFDGEKYSHYSVVTSEASGFNLGAMMAKSISGSSGVTTSSMPTDADGVRIFNEVFQTSFKDTLIALQTRVKNDKNFVITAPVTHVEGSTVYSSIGVQEDIRVDHPMYAYRTNLEGEAVESAWVKIRVPGKNCALMADDKRTESAGELISGEIEEADLLVEMPWTGVFFGLQYENVGRSFTDNVSSENMDFGALNIVSLYFNGDLGYLMNSPIMSDVWMNLDLGLGASGSNLDSLDTGGAYDFAFGLTKRWDIVSGMYIGVGADLDYIATSNAETGTADTSISTSVISIQPEVTLGYQFNPYVEINGGVGYDVPFSTSVSKYRGDTKVADLDIDANSGLSIFISASYHLDFAGPFAKMFASKKNECQKYKK